MSTTNIEVTINKIGEAEGTVGWLVQQPIKIKIETCKGTDTMGCCLQIGDAYELVALEGYVFSKEAGFFASAGKHDIEVDRIRGMKFDEKYAFNVCFTDACWEKVEELMSRARYEFHYALSQRDEAEGKVVANFAVTKV